MGLVHLVHEELHTGVISRGVPTPILKLVIAVPVVAHVKLTGEAPKLIPLQSQ